MIIIVGLVLVSLVVVYRAIRRSNAYLLPLPPGPTELPIIGNILQLPTHDSHLKYREWRKIYGDILHLKVFGTHTIILNSARVAFDLLEKRGRIYSDRPPSIMGQLAAFSETWAFLPYGELLRQFRKLANPSMNARAMERYQHLLEEEARYFSESIVRDPDSLSKNVNRFTSSIILRFLYGFSHSAELDLLSATSQKIVDDSTEMFKSGLRPVEVLPILRYLPSWLAPFKRRAIRMRHSLQYVLDIPFEHVKQSLVSGRDSFSSSLGESLLKEGHEDHSRSSDEENLVKILLGSLYPPGQETMASTLATFFLLMAANPLVQDKAQAEIAAVVGNQRLPEMTDRKRLPYLEAILKEVLRWQSVVPLGLPHRLTEDDEYNGYRIPKGSIIFPNIWEMMHDESMYTDPLTFNPERFIGGTEKSDSGFPYTPLSYVFGFGRRLCPGLHLAEASLFIAMATVLATSRIERRCDANGSEIPIEIKFATGLVSHPEYVNCSVKPQSENAVELLQHALDRAHERLTT